jgi:chemotaxis protein histidine kinase CheA
MPANKNTSNKCCDNKEMLWIKKTSFCKACFKVAPKPQGAWNEMEKRARQGMHAVAYACSVMKEGKGCDGRHYNIEQPEVDEQGQLEEEVVNAGLELMLALGEEEFKQLSKDTQLEQSLEKFNTHATALFDMCSAVQAAGPFDEFTTSSTKPVLLLANKDPDELAPSVLIGWLDVAGFGGLPSHDFPAEVKDTWCPLIGNPLEVPNAEDVAANWMTASHYFIALFGFLLTEKQIKELEECLVKAYVTGIRMALEQGERAERPRTGGKTVGGKAPRAFSSSSSSSRVAEEAAAALEADAHEAEEDARQAQEAAAREALARQAEEVRQAEEAARKAEEARQAEEAARQAEEVRQAEEAARKAEEAARKAEEAARVVAKPARKRKAQGDPEGHPPQRRTGRVPLARTFLMHE